MVGIKELEQAKEDCQSIAPLPEGYRIDVDRGTFNLIVHGPTLCFCVTSTAIEQGYHKTTFTPSLQALIEAEAEGANTVHLPPVIEPANARPL